MTAGYVLLFTLVSLAVTILAHARLRAVLRKRTDSDLLEDLRELRLHYRSDGRSALQADFDRESASTGAEEIFLALVTAKGEIVASSDAAPWRGLTLALLVENSGAPGAGVFSSIAHPLSGEPVRSAFLTLDDGSVLCIFRSLDEENEWMEIFRGILLLALLGMLASGSLMGWLLAWRAMAGVARVTRLASGMGRDRLGERVAVGRDGQEIEDLAVAFNGMLVRIDSLVRNLGELTDDFAHDLRSPVTRLRGAAETTLMSDAGLHEYRELAAMVVEEADALIAMLNTMLEIAETESGRARIEVKPVTVSALLEETHELYRPAAEDSGISLVCNPGGEELVVRADRARLQRVLANLLDNAIKYTPRGGRIVLSAVREGERAAIAVTDTGAGISANDLPHVFERFYRADSSRSRSGSGLGLSLSRAIVTALGGEIRVSSRPGDGSVFTVYLHLSHETGT